MFQRLKKVLAKDKALDHAMATHHEDSVRAGTAVHVGAPHGEGTQDISLRRESSVSGVQGMLQDKPWKLERAASSRDYIVGKELRGRADMAVDAQVSVIIMNRPLKELLEKRAYALYTDSIETVASPTLMEEMRWLALYPQVGWGSLADSFWHRYAVMTGHREHAMSWVNPQLANLLMTWHESATAADIPFILMVMRGKVRLRMQLTPEDANTLKHITRLFKIAAQSAVDVFADRSGESAESSKE
jgi:hypothetical protein